MKKFLGLGKATDVEPQEFILECDKFMANISNVLKVEQQLQSWLKATKTLKDLAMEVAETVETEERNDLSQELEDKQDSEIALAAIKTKMTLLKEIVSQHKRAKKEREEYVKMNKKLESMIEKNKLQEANKQTAATVELMTQKTLEVKQKADKLYEEVFTAIKFINSQTENRGASELIKHELNTFRVSQFEYLLRCQKLIQGRGDTKPIDYDRQWKVFLEQKHDQLYEDRVDVVKDFEKVDDTISSLRETEESAEVAATKKILRPRKTSKKKAPTDSPKQRSSKENVENDADDNDDDLVLKTSEKKLKKVATGLENLTLDRPKKGKKVESFEMMPEYLDVQDDLDWKQIETMKNSSDDTASDEPKADYSNEITKKGSDNHEPGKEEKD